MRAFSTFFKNLVSLNQKTNIDPTSIEKFAQVGSPPFAFFTLHSLDGNPIASGKLGANTFLISSPPENNSSVVGYESASKATDDLVNRSLPILLDQIDPNELAEDLFKSGVDWVIKNADAMYGIALKKAQVVPYSKIETFAITVNPTRNQYQIMYNPEFLILGTIRILLSHILPNTLKVPSRPTIWSREPKIPPSVSKPIAFALMHELLHQFYGHVSTGKKMGISELVSPSDIQYFGDGFINNYLIEKMGWPEGSEVFGITRVLPLFGDGKLKSPSKQLKENISTKTYGLSGKPKLFNLLKKGKFNTDLSESQVQAILEPGSSIQTYLLVENLYKFLTSKSKISSLEFIQISKEIEDYLQTNATRKEVQIYFNRQKEKAQESTENRIPGEANNVGEDIVVSPNSPSEGSPEISHVAEYPPGTTVREKATGEEFIVMYFDEETGEYIVGKPEPDVDKKKLPIMEALHPQLDHVVPVKRFKTGEIEPFVLGDENPNQSPVGEEPDDGNSPEDQNQSSSDQTDEVQPPDQSTSAEDLDGGQKEDLNDDEQEESHHENPDTTPSGDESQPSQDEEAGPMSEMLESMQDQFTEEEKASIQESIQEAEDVSKTFINEHAQESAKRAEGAQSKEIEEASSNLINQILESVDKTNPNESPLRDEIQRQKQFVEEQASESQVDASEINDLITAGENQAFWKRKLNEFLSKALGVEDVYNPTSRSRTIPAKVDPVTGKKRIILGAYEEVKKVKRIILAIDYSQSMGSSKYRLILEELQNILKHPAFRQVKVILVPWGSPDQRAVSQKIVFFPKPRQTMFNRIMNQEGEWATDLLPGVELISKRFRNADAIIWMTDMELNLTHPREIRSVYRRLAERSLWVLTIKRPKAIQNLVLLDPKWRKKTILARTNMFKRRA